MFGFAGMKLCFLVVSIGMAEEWWFGCPAKACHATTEHWQMLTVDCSCTAASA
jgi:hypothetical protein